MESTRKRQEWRCWARRRTNTRIGLDLRWSGWPGLFQASQSGDTQLFMMNLVVHFSMFHQIWCSSVPPSNKAGELWVIILQVAILWHLWRFSPKTRNDQNKSHRFPPNSGACLQKESNESNNENHVKNYFTGVWVNNLLCKVWKIMEDG